MPHSAVFSSRGEVAGLAPSIRTRTSWPTLVNVTPRRPTSTRPATPMMKSAVQLASTAGVLPNQSAERNRPLAICKDLDEFTGAWRFSDEFHHQCLHRTQILEQPRTRIRRTPAFCYGTVNVSAHEKSAAKEDEQSPAEIKGEKSECHRRSLRSDQS